MNERVKTETFGLFLLILINRLTILDYSYKNTYILLQVLQNVPVPFPQ